MKRRREESGFAVLLIFVLASVIAITLYFEMPRVAFESQRMREQMTIDRANEYKRAIQLFYRKYRTYPTNLDDLETTRNIRFLRRRYKDPLTGKDFRLLHIGPAGNLTDSLIKPANPLGTNGAPGAQAANGPNGQNNSAQNGQTQTGFAQTGFAQTGQTQNGQAQNGQAQTTQDGQPPANQGLNMALRRPSDRIIGGGPEVPPDPNQQAQYPQDPQQPGQPVDPNQPQNPAQPGQPGLPGVPQYPGQAAIPGQTGEAGQPQNPGQPGNPAQPGYPAQPQYPGQQAIPGQPGYPALPQYPAQLPYPVQTQNPGLPQYPGQSQYPVPSGAPPGVAGQQYPFPNQPGFGTQGFQNPGGAVPPGVANPAQPGATPNSAAGLIQQILTTPRQPPSSLGTTPAVTGGGVAIGGVSSDADGKGIHLINDHAKYKEWEFVYDIKKDKTIVGAAGAATQQQIQQQIQQITNPQQNQNNPQQPQPAAPQTGQTTSGSN